MRACKPWNFFQPLKQGWFKQSFLDDNLLQVNVSSFILLPCPFDPLPVEKGWLMSCHSGRRAVGPQIPWDLLILFWSAIQGNGCTGGVLELVTTKM